MNQYNNHDRDFENWHRYGSDRGFFDRVSDEVRSWFGDEDAERRRQQDQHMEHIRGQRHDHEGMRREERPQWQDRKYSGPSPRGSFINEHGRFDEPYREQRGGRRVQQRYYGGGYGGGYGAGLGYGAAERYGRREERGLSGRWNEDRMTRGYGYEYGPGGYPGARMAEERGDLYRRNWEDEYSHAPRFFEEQSEGEMYRSHRGRGPKNYQRSDERILDEIHQYMTYHSELDATDIDVVVESGIVTLRGNVDSRSSKRLAEDVAEEVYGVKEVRNELRVNNQSGLGLGSNNLSSSQQLGRDRIGNSR